MPLSRPWPSVPMRGPPPSHAPQHQATPPGPRRATGLFLTPGAPRARPPPNQSCLPGDGSVVSGPGDTDWQAGLPTPPPRQWGRPELSPPGASRSKVAQRTVVILTPKVTANGEEARGTAPGWGQGGRRRQCCSHPELRQGRRHCRDPLRGHLPSQALSADTLVSVGKPARQATCSQRVPLCSE